VSSTSPVNISPIFKVQGSKFNLKNAWANERRQCETPNFNGRLQVIAVVSITSQNVNLLTPGPKRRSARSKHAKRPANIGVFVRRRCPDSLWRTVPYSTIL